VKLFVPSGPIKVLVAIVNDPFGKLKLNRYEGVWDIISSKIGNCWTIESLHFEAFSFNAFSFNNSTSNFCPFSASLQNL